MFSTPGLKRAFAVMLALCMLLTLAACKSAKEQQTANDTAAPTEAVKETEAPATESPAETEPEDTLPPTEPEPTEALPPAVPVEPELPEHGYKIACAQDTTYAINDAGELYGWGRNDRFQLGGAAEGDSSVPVKITDGAEQVKVVGYSADNYFVLLKKTDGGLYVWGTCYGQLFSETPVLLLENVKSFGDSWAILNNGDLYAWIVYDTDCLIPEKVAENVNQCADGVYITNDCELYGFGKTLGANGYQLEKLLDRAVSVCRVDVGVGCYIAAIDAEGGLYAVGYGREGYEVKKLMDNAAGVQPVVREGMYIYDTEGGLWAYGSCQGWFPKGADESPVKVMDGVASVTAGYEMNDDYGYFYNFALKTDGTLWAWGYTRNGTLGVGETDELEIDEPVRVAEDVEKVYCDGFSTFIIKNDGSLWATGFNGNTDSAYLEGDCRLGDGTDETRYEFVKITDGVSYIVQRFCEMSLPPVDEYDEGGTCLYARAFAVKTDGSLWGWGVNKYGSIGCGSEKPQRSPVRIMDGLL